MQEKAFLWEVNHAIDGGMQYSPLSNETGVRDASILYRVRDRPALIQPRIPGLRGVFFRPKSAASCTTRPGFAYPVVRVLISST